MSDQPDTKTIPNPERGCGRLNRGKAYIRGIAGSGNGVLPSFVRCDPPIPYLEIGTNGSFTRSFQEIDGLTLQLAAEGDHDFIPLSPSGEYADIAYDRMIEHMDYETRVEIPEEEVDRHIDRIRHRGRLSNDDPQSAFAQDWGRSPVAEQTDLLMRAGESYYPEADDFIEEARVHGLSKAIPTSRNRAPPTVVPGITRCWVMSPDAGEGDYGGAVIGYAYIQEIVFTEPEDGAVPAYIEEYEQEGRLNVVDIEEPSDASASEQKNASIDEWIEDGEEA